MSFFFSNTYKYLLSYTFFTINTIFERCLINYYLNYVTTLIFRLNLSSKLLVMFHKYIPILLTLFSVSGCGSSSFDTKSTDTSNNIADVSSSRIG